MIRNATLEMVGEAEVGGTVHGLLIGLLGSSVYSLVPLSGSGEKVSCLEQYRFVISISYLTNDDVNLIMKCHTSEAHEIDLVMRV